MKLYEKYEGKKLKIAEKIQQRRRQILVHSYIYYELNANIISDAQWSKWAVELAELQRKYPKTSKRIQYAEQFQGWDGSTGAFLEYDVHIMNIAERLLMHKQQSKQKQSIVKEPKVGKVKKKSHRKRLF